MYPTVPTYPSTFDFGQFSAFGGADNATVTFSASPEFASTSFSVKYDVGGTRPESDLSDKVVVTKTMKLKPAATRAADQAATRAGEPLPYEFVDNYTITVPAVADAPKRTYIDAWVYIHSFDGPGGTDSIRVRRYAGGDASKILYMDGAGKLQVGAWGTATQANMLFFKTHSVLGMSGTTNNDPFDATDVKYNPSAVVPTDTYSSVISGNISATTAINAFDPIYNTATNIKTYGRGDPCTLVGLSVADIAAMSDEELQQALDNSPWRLPTMFENVSFVGGPAVPVANATFSYWKDVKVGDPFFRFMSTTGSADEYTYPTGEISTSPKYNYFTTGTPGLAKFPLVAQGAVAAGTYTLPAVGNRDNNNAGMFRSMNNNVMYQGATKLTHSIIGSSLTITSIYHVGGHGKAVRCVAR
jgi:hypothetical protein